MAGDPTALASSRSVRSSALWLSLFVILLYFFIELACLTPLFRLTLPKTAPGRWFLPTVIALSAALSSFLHASIDDPGSVTEAVSSATASSDKMTIVRKRNGGKRICKRCEGHPHKPDRTHHSVRLGRCVQEFDSFSLLCNNAIGASNRKSHYLFMAYTCLTMVLIVIQLGQHLSAVATAGAGRRIEAFDAFLVVAWIALGAATCFWCGMLMYRTWLMARGTTEHEYYKSEEEPFYAQRPFSAGVWSNLVWAFGSRNPVDWLKPGFVDPRPADYYVKAGVRQEWSVKARSPRPVPEPMKNVIEAHESKDGGIYRTWDKESEAAAATKKTS